ncbi:MAG TPA: NAD(P)/FAD-dependent oxidoreductase, partial [Steroidobacteraceae bacterium]
MTERDEMEYDVLIVGAGPAGLACAIRLKQCKPELSVCVLEKASTVGAHLLSGAVLEPGPLDALCPAWRQATLPVCVAASRDEMRLLTRKGSIRLPLPPQLHNAGNLIISLGGLAPWLATQAETLGVDVFAGFAGAEALFDAAGAVNGVRIGDMGLNADGTPGPNYTAGPNIRAKTTVLAEGC